MLYPLYTILTDIQIKKKKYILSVIYSLKAFPQYYNTG